jgi:peroxidase
VNLVDAWVGGIAEDHVPGTDLGPLLEASLIQQFTAVRDGDRFWFTCDSGLTPDDLNFVDNVTLAGIIAADTGITNLQSDDFLAAVSEPASYLLAAAGLAFLTMAYRNRRAQAV